MRKLYFFWSFVFVCAFGAYGNAQQLDTFSVNRASFLSELEDKMTSSGNAKREEVFKSFSADFKGGLFSDLEFEQIRQTANQMLEKRMNSDFFSAYLSAAQAVRRTERGEERFPVWQGILLKMLTDKTRPHVPFLSFLRFSEPFFTDNLLHASNSNHNWEAVSDDYQMGYVEDAPLIKFDRLDLVVSKNQDSIVISQTEGIFYPLEKSWKGKGGKVSWERYESMQDVYAELQAYTINTGGSFYEAEDVLLHYPLFFGEQKIPGRLNDKLTPTNATPKGTHPRFESNQKVLEINNIGKGVEYIGGFRLHGTTVYGYGTKEAPAQLKLSNNEQLRLSNAEDKLVFTGKSQLFTIRQGKVIAGEGVNSSLLLGNGESVTHPAANLLFDIEKKELTLSRGTSGSALNPFYDSYHKVNISSESIIAYIDEDSVVIGRRNLPYSLQDDVNFESLQFFNPSDYYRVQNIATANPIAIMKMTAERMKTDKLRAETLAKSINPRLSAENIQSLLYHLVALGFVNYDSESQIVQIKDKAFHYVEADQGQIDYDVLRIRSNIDSINTNNAFIDLKKQTIEILGVRPIEFSHAQQVALKAADGRVILKENRNLDFGGKIFAGFSTLEGKDFHFDYDKFHIQLDSVKYFDLFLHDGKFDKNGKPEAFSIASRIEDLSGYLLIDAPSNKAGKDSIHMFPSLQSKQLSYVYYDQEKTQGGAYLRDSFYFELKPFSFNYLDEFTSKDVRFEGKLVSANIFPDIEETLVIQKDVSLGFDTETKEGGLPIYTGQGNYTGNIHLSNRGLLGKGVLQYLGASIDSEDFVFKPEQTTGTADEFFLAESVADGLEVPQVQGEAVSIDWRPYVDSMYIKSETAPFDFFKDEKHTLKGTLILTPDGVRGDGKFDWDKATLSSKLFSFGTYSVDADTSTINIKTLDLENSELALQTKDVRSEVDFKEEIGRFKANDPLMETLLPYNKYKTSMNEFEWDMNKEGVTFITDEDHLGLFTSLDGKRDSLNFKGYQAYYDLKTNELLVGGVPHIISADAFIYPDSNQLTIQAGGEMQTLENAQIVADTLNQNHVINRATVNVFGRRNYTAKGFYEYNIGDKEQEIEFQNIDGRPVGNTRTTSHLGRVLTTATGDVRDTANFFIDHKTRFRGRIKLTSDSENLDFRGFAQLDAENLPGRYWFSIQSEGDKRDLAIQYEKPTSDEGFWLYTGLFLGKQNAQVYPLAMMPLEFRKDRTIFPATGVFKYLEDKDQFVFGDSSRVILSERKGNKFIFDNGTSEAFAEGRFQLGSGLNYISIDAVGKANTKFRPPAPEETAAIEAEENKNIISAESLMPAEEEPAVPEEPEYSPVNAEFMAGIKLILPDQFFKVMLTDIQSSSFDADIIAYLADLEFYQNAASELFSTLPEIEEYVAAIGQGFMEIPPKSNPYNLLFSKLKMVWDPQTQSFLSTEDKIGVAAVNGFPINKKLECKVQFMMPSNEDDRLYIHIKTPSEYFYYFGYKQGILTVTSNNDKFMAEFDKLKAKDLVLRMDDGETYEIVPEEVGVAKVFLRRMQAALQSK